MPGIGRATRSPQCNTEHHLRQKVGVACKVTGNERPINCDQINGGARFRIGLIR
jgi:hypothetical protein